MSKHEFSPRQCPICNELTHGLMYHMEAHHGLWFNRVVRTSNSMVYKRVCPCGEHLVNDLFVIYDHITENTEKHTLKLMMMATK